MVRKHPMLVLVRLLGSGVAQLIGWLFILVAVGALLANLFTAPTHFFDRVLEQLTSKTYIMGATGAFASVTLIGWLIDAWTRAATWITIQRQMMYTDQTHYPKQLWVTHVLSSIWSQATGLSAHALAWSVVKTLTGLSLAIMLSGTYIGLLYLQPQFGPFGNAMLLALFYAMAFVFVALTLGVLAWYPSLVVTSPEMHPGDRVLTAAQRVLNNPNAIYALFINAYKPVFPMFFVYFVLSIAGPLSLQNMDLYNLVSSLSFLVDIAIAVTLILSSIAFRAGSSYLEAHYQNAFPAPAELVEQQHRQRELVRQNKSNPLHSILVRAELSSKRMHHDRLEQLSEEEKRAWMAHTRITMESKEKLSNPITYLTPKHMIPTTTPHVFSFDEVLNPPEQDISTEQAQDTPSPTSGETT